MKHGIRIVKLRSLELTAFDRRRIGSKLYEYYKHEPAGSFLAGKRIGSQEIRSIEPFFGVVERQGHLEGHVLATSIREDASFNFEENGWNSVVSRAAEDRRSNKRRHWAVALHLLVEEDSRGKGVAEQLLRGLAANCRDMGYTRLIIPLLLPSSTSLEYSESQSMNSILERTETGQYKDHWLRLHIKLGAQIIGLCGWSHVYGVRCDEMDKIKAHETTTLLKLDDNTVIVGEGSRYYRFSLDKAHRVWLARIPCVWVSHSLGGNSC